jgi:hemolysin III
VKTTSTDADPHVTEALANAITHGLGLAASLIAVPVMIARFAGYHDKLRLAGAVVYGLSLIALFATSTAYHSFARSPARPLLRTIDHSAIYILIAGSYTPFALGPLRGPFGYSLLAAVWTMAIVGVTLKFRLELATGWKTVIPYIAMGWLAVVGFKPLLDTIGVQGMAWMLAGGLFYSGGVYFFAFDRRIRYGHAAWHLFVLAGSICHFVAVLWHAGARPG